MSAELKTLGALNTYFHMLVFLNVFHHYPGLVISSARLHHSHWSLRERCQPRQPFLSGGRKGISVLMVQLLSKLSGVGLGEETVLRIKKILIILEMFFSQQEIQSSPYQRTWIWYPANSHRGRDTQLTAHLNPAKTYEVFEVKCCYLRAT